MANYARAEMTRNLPAFFALIWNNEVSNKVTHRALSVRPAAEDKQGRPAIEKRLDVWPCSLLWCECCGPPRCEQRPCRSRRAVVQLSKRKLTVRSSPSQSLHMRKGIAPCERRRRCRLDRKRGKSCLSQPAWQTILGSNLSQTEEMLLLLACYGKRSEGFSCQITCHLLRSTTWARQHFPRLVFYEKFLQK